MTTVHVVMKQRRSPIVHFEAHPHEVYPTKKEACDRAKELNNKSRANLYWVEPSHFVQPTSEEP